MGREKINLFFLENIMYIVCMKKKSMKITNIHLSVEMKKAAKDISKYVGGNVNNRSSVAHGIHMLLLDHMEKKGLDVSGYNIKR